MIEQADIVIVGAGAAGLMTAIWAGRTMKGKRIIVVDGARKLGAKILVAGGGRCNVTHDVVDEKAYAGSSRNAIKKVLRRFDMEETAAFFREIGVELKREETGKLFPVTDDARTVLNALLRETERVGAEVVFPRRVERVTRRGERFAVQGDDWEIECGRVVLATGGRSLPKSGSDGAGYDMARMLGHSITKRVFPALVPLTLPKEHFVCQLSGLTLPATLEVRSGSGAKLASFTDSTLCTHFGLSGPSVLDISRYWRDALFDDRGVKLVINWLPEFSMETLDAALRELGAMSPGRWLARHVADRLGRVLCEQAGVEASAPGHSLTREKRRSLAMMVTQCELPVTGDRGYNYAEVTAGGVPLAELQLSTMESRVCAGLHLVGEICDVDGRIGGYNFQWAWSSGYTAGVSVAGEK